MIYSMALRQHYELTWQTKCRELKWEQGPMMEKYPDFSVLEFAPGPIHDMWIYGTINMSAEREIELHLFCPIREESIAEILTVISYFHREKSSLTVGHTVNFGRSWLPRPRCTFGLISLPYLDGPILEDFKFGNLTTRCLWLIPLTQQEIEFKRKYGLEALESKFEKSRFNYLDPKRRSVV